jgi:Holliday junction resolvase RusA-like endonuclease
MENMKWFIPGNVPSSKNSRRWTGKFFIASKTTMKYRKNTDSIYKKHAASFAKEFAKYESPVYVSFKFTRGSRHKFDHVNPLQTVQDEMVKHGWIEDDNATFIIPVIEDYDYDKVNPGVLIKIEENYESKNKRKDANSSS